MDIGSRRAASGPGGRLSAATSFFARTVIDSDGQLIGSIGDVMLDIERGRIAYVIVAAGGFVGLGERLFAVPWSALHPVGDQYMLECKRNALDAAPAFDRDHWPLAPGYGWHERVHAYYNSRPYWE